jgi:sugar/nucleoside kinase (ribokinase family)
MSGWDVVGVGESSVDEIYRLPSAPGPNVKLPISSRQIRYGGQVATTLATCAAFGLRTALIGTAGDDDEQVEGLLAALERCGVNTSHVVHRSVRHRRAVILVNEANGDRTVLWERDPRLVLNATDLPRDVIASARLVHVDSVDEDAAIAAAEIARAAGVPVTSDIDRVTDRTGALVAAVTVPIFAEHVPESLTGEANTERALRKLRGAHGGMLCVTLGARGSMLLEGNQLYRVPARAVHVVDATGAGDVFRGAFIHALLRGDSPVDMLRFANTAAALSCTRAGALDSVPTREEVEEFLEGKGQRSKGKG